MICTNYSVDPFKTISTLMNTAAADHVAAIMESADFHKWLGSNSLPKIKDLKITNVTGDVWDLRETLSTWRKQEQIKQGYWSKEGNPVIHPINTPGILKYLSAQTKEYNNPNNPFKARIVRKNVNGEEVYNIVVDFNTEYEKPEKPRLSDKPVVERDDVDSFFYMRRYDPTVFSNGMKTVSIRPNAYQPGVYNIGNEFFRVSLREKTPMYVKQAKEGKDKLRKNFIQDDEIEFSHINDFFEGKVRMFIYDIEKLNIKEEEAKAMPDFLGAMAFVTAPGKRKSKELTGYADIDKYIEALIETKSALYRQRAGVKTDVFKVRQIDNRIESINMSIARLKEDSELTTLMNVGKQVLYQLQKDVKNVISFTEIDNGLRLAKAWKELDKVVEFDNESADEETKAILKDAEQLRSMAQTLFTQYYNKYVGKLLETVDQHVGMKADDRGNMIKASETILNEEGQITIEDSTFMESRFIGKSFSKNAMVQLLDTILSKSDYKAQQESYAYESRMNEAVKELLGILPDKTKAKDFDFLFRKDAIGNQTLVTKYHPDFQKELYINRYRAFDKGKGRTGNKSDNYNAAIALGATTDELKTAMPVKEYFEWEKKHFTYELSKEGQEAFDAFMLETRDANIIGRDEESNPIYDEAAIEEVRKEYDPQIFQEYITGKSKAYKKGSSKWFSKVITSAPVSKEYATMSPKQMKFYEFYVGEYMAGQQDLAIDHRFGEIDLDRQLLDFTIGVRGDLKDQMHRLGKNLGDFVKGIGMVRDFDDGIIHNPRSALTGLERKGAEFRHISEFIPAADSRDNINPIVILSKFRQWGHLFKHKREIEDTLYALRDLSYDAEKVESTAYSKLKTTKLGTLFTTKSTSNIAETIEYNINVALTGQRKEPHKVEGKRGEWKGSGGQLIDSINNYTRFKAMALSPMSGIGNFVMGGVNNFIYASSGQYFNDKELTHAYWLLKQNVVKGVFLNKVVGAEARKIAELMKRYRILGDVTEELYHENDLLSQFYIMQKNGEFMNQAATTIAQMLRQKVDMKDGSKKRLWDLYEIEKDTNLLKFRGDLVADADKFKDDNNVFLFFEKTRKVNMKIHGDYTNPLMIKKDVWGRVLLMFRTWLPMAVKERFGKEYEDELLGTQKGRVISVWNVLTTAAKNRDKDSGIILAKMLGKLIVPVLGRKIKFGNKLSEIDQHNINMFVREIHFLLMLTLSIAAVKAQVDDEDDEDAQNVFRYIYNQGERTQTELMFFFAPKDFMQITKDAIPLSQTVTEAGRVFSRSYNYITGEEDEYQKGFRKGNSKLGKAVNDLVPVIRQIEKTRSAASQIFTDTRYQ